MYFPKALFGSFYNASHYIDHRMFVVTQILYCALSWLSTRIQCYPNRHTLSCSVWLIFYVFPPTNILVQNPPDKRRPKNKKSVAHLYFVHAAFSDVGFCKIFSSLHGLLEIGLSIGSRLSELTAFSDAFGICSEVVLWLKYTFRCQ